MRLVRPRRTRPISYGDGDGDDDGDCDGDGGGDGDGDVDGDGDGDGDGEGDGLVRPRRTRPDGLVFWTPPLPPPAP